MKLIVGLGNPGKEYQKTRHNIGFEILDNYIGNEKWSEKFNGQYIKKIVNNEVVIFLKPLTFMNLSGSSVYKFVDYFDINIEDILVIQDDIDIEFGLYKMKRISSSGGHNGIKSIINSLKSDEFLRLKIGVKNNQENNVIDFVLGKFSKEEWKQIMDNFQIYDKIIDSFIRNGPTKTMELYKYK